MTSELLSWTISYFNFLRKLIKHNYTQVAFSFTKVDLYMKIVGLSILALITIIINAIQ